MICTTCMYKDRTHSVTMQYEYQNFRFIWEYDMVGPKNPKQWPSTCYGRGSAGKIGKGGEKSTTWRPFMGWVGAWGPDASRRAGSRVTWLHPRRLWPSCSPPLIMGHQVCHQWSIFHLTYSSLPHSFQFPGICNIIMRYSSVNYNIMAIYCPQDRGTLHH